MKSSRRSKKKAPSASRDKRIDVLQLDRFAAKAAVFVRRMALSYSTLSTGVGGTLAWSAIANTSNVQVSCPDFASCANIYGAYRVRAMEVHLLPAFVVNTTAVTVPLCVATCTFQAGAAPANYAAIVDGSNVQMLSGYKQYKLTCDDRRDPNARLWTPTSAAVPTGNNFGIVICGSTTTSTASTLIWAVQAWAVVEFQSAA